MSDRYQNSHPQGYFSTEGWANTWLTRHQAEINQLTPNQMQLYWESMDRLYLQAEHVRQIYMAI